MRFVHLLPLWRHFNGRFDFNLLIFKWDLMMIAFAKLHEILTVGDTLHVLDVTVTLPNALLCL